MFQTGYSSQKDSAGVHIWLFFQPSGAFTVSLAGSYKFVPLSLLSPAACFYSFGQLLLANKTN
jgi:hypothetical protein